jgi:hypothetical protein
MVDVNSSNSKHTLGVTAATVLLSTKELKNKYFVLKERCQMVCLLCNPEWSPDSQQTVKH